MSLDAGNLAQWAAVLVAAASLIVAILGLRKANKATKDAETTKQAIAEIKVQIETMTIQSGGGGGTGGQFGGGGGGGGGAGQSGGAGGSIYLESNPDDR